MEDLLTDNRSRLSTDNAEKLLILKENLFKFWTGCITEQCEFDGLIQTITVPGMIGDYKLQKNKALDVIGCILVGID